MQPGDVLLFRRRGVFNWTIEHATNAPVSHSEVFVGPLERPGLAHTAACRNGVGVNFYPLELEGLAVILRPKRPFDLEAALAYQRSVIGQGYDWSGLWRAFVRNTWGRNSVKQWCSENSTLVQRAGGIEPFAPDCPADMIAPGHFLTSAAYFHLWKVDGFPI